MSWITDLRGDGATFETAWVASKQALRERLINSQAKDPQITCIVVTNGKVEYKNQTLSPIAAALLAVKSLGYNWAALSGSDYRELDGETLTARRLRLEDEQ